MSDNNQGQGSQGTGDQGSQNNQGAGGAQGGDGGAGGAPKGSNQQPWMKVLNEDLAARGAGEGKPDAGKPGDKGAAGGAAGAGAAGGAGSGDKTKTFQLDEKTLQGLIKQVADKGAGGGGAAQPPPRELSEAELNKMFNVYNADENILKALGLEATPERLSTLNTVLQAISKQSTTIASVQLQMALDKMKKDWEEQFNPVLDYMKRARMEQMRTRFFDKYKDLQGLEPLVMKVKDSFIAQNKQFESEDEAFKAVYDEVQGLLSSLKDRGGDGGGDNGQDGQNRNKQQQQNANASGMPSLSSGGQGGTGANRSGGASKPAWQKALAD